MMRIRIRFRNLFDPGSRMEKFGYEFRDKHPWSATLLNTFDPLLCSVQISRCEQLPLLIKVWVAVGVAWGLSSCWCGLTRDLSSCLSSLRSEQLSLWFEARDQARMVWVEVFWIWDAGMVWCLSSCRYCSREVGAGYLYGSISEQLPALFEVWAAAGVVWGLSSSWYVLRPARGAARMGWDLWAVNMVWGQSSCRYVLRFEQLPIWFDIWAAAPCAWPVATVAAIIASFIANYMPVVANLLIVF